VYWRQGSATPLSPSITHLSVSDKWFDLPVENLLPSKLTHLYFGVESNMRDFPPSIPFIHAQHDSVKNKYQPQITRGLCAFNQPIDNLPPLLTTLILGCSFNGSLDHLPSSLLHLVTGPFFNSPIDYLPSSLKLLEVGDSFNRPIDFLPSSLSHLTLNAAFNQPIDYLPHQLTHLKINSNRYSHSLDHLPTSLIELGLPEDSPPLMNHLPSHMKKLLAFSIEITDFLPPTLTHLYFGNKFNHPVDHLPLTLTHLEFGRNFNQPVDHLPPGLQVLNLGFYFQHNLDYLPESLLELHLEGQFNLPLDNLPPSLRILSFARGLSVFDRPLDNLPNMVEFLELSERFSQNMRKWPVNLKVLAIKTCRFQSLQNLPPGVEKLIVKRTFPNLPVDLANIPKRTKVTIVV
jgi:FNIP Repeat